MPPLFRLVVNADTSTETVLNPKVENFIYIFDPSDVIDDTLYAPATDFVDDDNNPITELTLADPENGYYLLVINGMLQQSSVYSVTAGELIVLDADDILTSSPIVLTVSNFVPISASVTTVET